MVSKTRKIRKRVSNRVLQMWNDPTNVWGKNPSLESFWSDLASGKKVVLIYKDGNTYVDLPKRTTRKYQDRMVGFEEDKSIVAILSSNHLRMPTSNIYIQRLRTVP